MAPFDFRRYLGLTDEELARLPRYDPQHPRLIRLLAALVWMKRRRILRESLIVVVGMAVAITAFVAVMAVIGPWNHSLFLWPTLTGTWFGDFVTPDGRKHLLLLQIDGDRENPPIGGTAATCDDRGVVREFSLSGWPHGWRGKAFRIDASGTGDTDGAGVGSGRLDGAYDGDTMRVEARLDYFGRVNGAVGSSTAAPPGAPLVQVMLRRRGKKEFTAACGRIRGTA